MGPTSEGVQGGIGGRIRGYPDNTYLQRRAWFLLAVQDDTIPEKDGIAAVDTFLRAVDPYDGPSSRWAFYPDAAQLLVKRGGQPEREIDLLKQAKSDDESGWARGNNSDNLSDVEVKRRLDWQRQQRQYLNGLMLKAAMQANKPEIAAELRAAVEGPPPDDKKLLQEYRANHARVALLTGNRIDALAYYQMVLQTKLEAPKPFKGRFRDDLGDEGHALWKQQGGTETAWATGSKMPSADNTILAEGRWEKPKRSIPDFELIDLSGKTWRLRELNGKSVLIDVWATWCGPCQAELPNLQKLYEQVKSRSDIQILAFNYDSDVGVVGPYSNEKGNTFPVLPIVNAAQIEDAVNDNDIPQNWVVLDCSGIFLWRQIGYRPENYDDFSKDMLTRLGAEAANE
ncbi:Thiol:disulfide oxidoreductase related to ResA [Acidisarcina polymorpha]|uniref:Thiol:disulfide oxidoreductase related to ResA n=1 Tax=Acidisarcina polymorpha TaxID=2211140 RepID=A0A2Z5FTP4_9BACT|nr:TlpA disulfide reductase family protein [Acidisarcina polymorpha]AXC10201.1 Thiol:disulfide oxidoreductase related to ResA [Acidisarcina polymorpha]